MKLNQDCVRDVLLFVESNITFGHFLQLDDFINAPELKRYDTDCIKYTLAKLDETDYLKSSSNWINNDLIRFSTGMITWQGHKFLDTIRDNKVWSTTKSVSRKIASVSLAMTENIASQVITNLVTAEMIKQGNL